MPRLAQVATRSAVLTTLHATATHLRSRTGHVAQDAIVAIAFVLPNWYVAAGGSGEAGSGGTVTWEAAVEFG